MNGALAPLEALFGELPLELVMTSDEDGRAPRMFRAAHEALARRDPSGARAAFEEITSANDVSSREQIQAWGFLRHLCSPPPSHLEKQVLGVIVEAGMDSGQDVLAAYADLTANYYNFTGSGVVWGRPDSSLDNSIDRVLGAASAIVRGIGPWREPRRPPAKGGMLRLSILTPIGLHFGEGPFETLDRDPVARPLVRAATSLMLDLTSLPHVNSQP